MDIARPEFKTQKRRRQLFILAAMLRQVRGLGTLVPMDSVLYVGRPAFGQENSTLSLFKLSPDGQGALRVPPARRRYSVMILL